MKSASEVKNITGIQTTDQKQRDVTATRSKILTGFGDVQLLGEVLRRAVREVPYYSELKAPSDNAGDDEILSFFYRFPLIDKPLLKHKLSSFLSSAFEVNKLRKASSSGSTGDPLTILRDRNEYLVENAFISRIWSSLGLKNGDSTVVLRTGYDPRQGDSISFVDERGTVWVQLSKLNEENLTQVSDLIQNLQPSLLRGLGSLVSALLCYSHKRGHSLSSLKAVAYSSDEMLPAERKFIRETMELKLVSLWGQTERAAMAVTPHDADEYHVISDYGFVELVRPDGTVITKPGEYGVIVGTSLFPRSTAMIRYQTGDVASWTRPGILGNIIGRGTGTMISRFGERIVFPIAIREAVLESVPEDTCVQFVQLKPGEVILRVDKPFRADMSPMELEFEKLKCEFDLEIQWETPLKVTSYGKRQLYVFS